MPDETKDPKQEATGGVEPQNADGKNPDAQTQSDNETQTFDKKYIEELRKEAAATRIKLKEFEAEKEKRERQLLEEQGKHKELYETTNKELTDIKAKYESIVQEVEAYRAEKEKERKEILKKLPSDVQKEFADLDKEKLLILLEKFNPKPPVNSQESNMNGVKPDEKKTHKSKVPFTSTLGGFNIYNELNNM